MCATASIKSIQMNGILCGTFAYEQNKILEKIKMQAKQSSHIKIKKWFQAFWSMRILDKVKIKSIQPKLLLRSRNLQNVSIQAKIALENRHSFKTKINLFLFHGILFLPVLILFNFSERVDISLFMYPFENLARNLGWKSSEFFIPRLYLTIQ